MNVTAWNSAKSPKARVLRFGKRKEVEAAITISVTPSFHKAEGEKPLQ